MKILFAVTAISNSIVPDKITAAGENIWHFILILINEIKSSSPLFTILMSVFLYMQYFAMVGGSNFTSVLKIFRSVCLQKEYMVKCYYCYFWVLLHFSYFNIRTKLKIFGWLHCLKVCYSFLLLVSFLHGQMGLWRNHKHGHRMYRHFWGWYMCSYVSFQCLMLQALGKLYHYSTYLLFMF